MTLADFRDTEIAARLAAYGKPYVTGSSQNAPISRALERFTEKTWCLFDDNISFTLSATDAFDFASSFGKKMLHIEAVYIGGTRIQRVVSQGDMRDMQAGYVTSSSGTPSVFWTAEPGTLYLFPEPTGAIASSYVSGYYLHPTLSADVDTLVIPDRDIDAAATYCAYALARPYARGEAVAELDKMLAGVEAEMAVIKARNIRVHNASMQPRRTSKVHQLA